MESIWKWVVHVLKERYKEESGYLKFEMRLFCAIRATYHFYSWYCWLVWVLSFVIWWHCMFFDSTTRWVWSLVRDMHFIWKTKEWLPALYLNSMKKFSGLLSSRHVGKFYNWHENHNNITTPITSGYRERSS